jgi:hypothetical protein
MALAGLRSIILRSQPLLPRLHHQHHVHASTLMAITTWSHDVAGGMTHQNTMMTFQHAGLVTIRRSLLLLPLRGVHDTIPLTTLLLASAATTPPITTLLVASVTTRPTTLRRVDLDTIRLIKRQRDGRDMTHRITRHREEHDTTLRITLRRGDRDMTRLTQTSLNGRRRDSTLDHRRMQRQPFPRPLRPLPLPPRSKV